MRISDWSSDVCSSDLSAQPLVGACGHRRAAIEDVHIIFEGEALIFEHPHRGASGGMRDADHRARGVGQHRDIDGVLGHQVGDELVAVDRVELIGLLEIHPEEFARYKSEEHTSELQSLMRNSYDVFCLKKKKNKTEIH